MKRSPLRIKRPTPRRKAPERVQGGRMKPKAGAPPTAEEKAHMGRVAALPCLACGKRGPSTVHHVTASIFGFRIPRSHRRVVPLCLAHHQHDHGPESVERLSHAGFFSRFGIDLLAEAERLWRESNAS